MGTKQHIRTIFSFLFAAALFASCEDKIDLDLPEGDTYLVVEAFLTTAERPHHFLLTYTQAFFDSSAQPKAIDAVVFLRGDEGSETLLEEIEPGLYRYPQGGTEGISYQLEISLPDGSNYLSPWELMRSVPPILDIRYGLADPAPSELFGQDPDEKYEVLIDTFEPPGVGDFYRWRSVVNGEPRNEPFDIFVASDEFVDGNPIIDFNPTGDRYFAGDTVVIFQESISGELFDFLSLIQAQTAFVGGPFDTPPAPINGNIKNVDPSKRDALGFFAVNGRYEASIIIAE
jgi:hypothetical protein